MARLPDRTRSFLSLVLDADPDYQFERRFPIAYRFRGRTFRTDAENSGAYAKSEEEQQS